MTHFLDALLIVAAACSVSLVILAVASERRR